MIYNFNDFDDSRSQGFGSSPSTSVYSQYNPDAYDIETVRKMTREMVHKSGAPVQVFIRTMNEDVNDVHDEDANPTYFPPRLLRGFYIPKPTQMELTLWGPEIKIQHEINFHILDIVENFGNRLLLPGDILQVPYNSFSKLSPGYYTITNAQEFGNFRYTWLYLKCQCTASPGDPNIIPDGQEITDARII